MPTQGLNNITLISGNLRIAIVGIISIIALLIGIGAFFLPTQYGGWECVQTECGAYMDETEIAEQVCSETDQDIAKYSILKGNEQIFASKYKLYLPTEEELKAEIEREKINFRLQMGEK